MAARLTAVIVASGTWSSIHGSVFYVCTTFLVSVIQSQLSHACVHCDGQDRSQSQCLSYTKSMAQVLPMSNADCDLPFQHVSNPYY